MMCVLCEQTSAYISTVCLLRACLNGLVMACNLMFRVFVFGLLRVRLADEAGNDTEKQRQLRGKLPNRILRGCYSAASRLPAAF